MLKRQSRGSFISLGTINNADAVLKVSTTDKEYVILEKLHGFKVGHVPEVHDHGDFDGGDNVGKKCGLDSFLMMSLELTLLSVQVSLSNLSLDETNQTLRSNTKLHKSWTQDNPVCFPRCHYHHQARFRT